MLCRQLKSIDVVCDRGIFALNGIIDKIGWQICLGL